jgi:hypothetical protein
MDTITEINDIISPTYYSIPYYVLNNNNTEYQYKLSLTDETMTLEEIKTISNELQSDINNTEDMEDIEEYNENVICTVSTHELNDGIDMIKKKLDIREEYDDPPPLEKNDIWGDDIQLDLSQFSREEAKDALENNKIIALLDIYEYINL